MIWGIVGLLGGAVISLLCATGHGWLNVRRSLSVAVDYSKQANQSPRLIFSRTWLERQTAVAEHLCACVWQTPNSRHGGRVSAQPKPICDNEIIVLLVQIVFDLRLMNYSSWFTNQFYCLHSYKLVIIILLCEIGKVIPVVI